jgi:putative addiction module killer protein
MYQIEVYVTPYGTEPFKEWFDSIRDVSTNVRIEARIRRITVGSLGDHKSIGGGVYKLRLPFGRGYRIYFGKVGLSVILLLCGGDKGSQTRDIRRAKQYWNNYQERRYGQDNK